MVTARARNGSNGSRSDRWATPAPVASTSGSRISPSKSFDRVEGWEDVDMARNGQMVPIDRPVARVPQPIVAQGFQPTTVPLPPYIPALFAPSQSPAPRRDRSAPAPATSHSAPQPSPNRDVKPVPMGIDAPVKEPIELEDGTATYDIPLPLNCQQSDADSAKRRRAFIFEAIKTAYAQGKMVLSNSSVDFIYS